MVSKEISLPTNSEEPLDTKAVKQKFFLLLSMASALGQFSLAAWVIIMLVTMHGHTCCMENERKALLELKSYANTAGGPDPFPSWTNDTENDCCSWGQIQCNLTNGHVIGIYLYSTVQLNSNFLLNLSLLHPFEELQSLNMTFTFSGWFDPIEGYKSLGRLRKLEVMDLSFGDLNISILPFFSAATSLKTLILRHCNLEGRFPMEELKDMRNLEMLDLSWNRLNGSLPGPVLANLHKLKALDLSDNEFSGSLDARGICGLKDLQELDLSRNKLVGYIPSCLGGLSKLVVLDLSENHLNGSLPPFIGNLGSLEYLSLYGNSFESLFSLSPLTNLSELKVFKLSSKSDLLQVELEQGSWQPKFQLNVIELTNCNLGEIPSFLKYQRELRKIDLSNNKMFGVFPTWLLENNLELEVLLLGSNALTMFQLPRLVHNLKVLVVSTNRFVEQLPVNIGQILPNINLLNFSHNGCLGTLPSSLGEMKSMQFLDLSYNYFSGSLSRNFTMGCHSLRSLLLSHNSFSGQIFQKSTNLTYLEVLKMDNNLFTGKIGDGLLNSSELSVLDLSNNHLTGAIPSWIGSLPLSVISLANNGFEGSIPMSFSNSSFESFLDLSGNRLSGSLPPHFIVKASKVKVYLHDNALTGPIPDTLLENVQVLDLRYNKLSGSIPHFLHTRNISILLLRGNNLTGPIPAKLCSLSKVILLDLAYNSLNGTIPSCLPNLSFGLGRNGEPQGLGGVGLSFDGGFVELYKYNSTLELDLWKEPDTVATRHIEIDFAAKHRYDSYTGYMYGLDLAGNELSGEIPKELGDLQRIRVLNLSHNSLSGHIPKSFSNMTDLESLDLSFNRLTGTIPDEFTKLDSLAVFNVSYNNLSGIIPRGKLTTFDDSSYTGNILLCGRPTNRSCSNIDDSETEEGFPGKEEDTVIDMVVFYWSLTVTYVAVFAGFVLFLCFESPPRQAWLNLVDAFIRLARRVLS